MQGSYAHATAPLIVLNAEVCGGRMLLTAHGEGIGRGGWWVGNWVGGFVAGLANSRADN